MKPLIQLTVLPCVFMLSACVSKGMHPEDPYEPFNRKIYAFNAAFDKAILRPPAKVYAAVVPAPVRAGINNVYNNVNMLPTVANDLLQAQWNTALKDSWRFVINSTLGIAGIFDPASTFKLPPHSNDMGLTFAKWGDKKSPYLVIPFLGPSTFRDGMGMMFDYALFTPYPYIKSDALLYSILGLRYIDLRSQMEDVDKLMGVALDKYAFMRDAYLQHRQYLMTGEEQPSAQQQESSTLYIEEESNKTNDTILPETPANGTSSKFPLTTAKHDTHSTAST